MWDRASLWKQETFCAGLMIIKSMEICHTYAIPPIVFPDYPMKGDDEAKAKWWAWYDMKGVDTAVAEHMYVSVVNVLKNEPENENLHIFRTYP